MKYPMPERIGEPELSLIRMPMELEQIKKYEYKLRTLVKADLLTEGISDIDFRGLQDGTLYRFPDK
ncbi:MAG: hypothetical protein HQK66_01740 [Desulfamplus sp.]|nr:hypothetical protein [Desulfamplus sp.]